MMDDKRKKNDEIKVWSLNEYSPVYLQLRYGIPQHISQDLENRLVKQLIEVDKYLDELKGKGK